MNTEPPSPEARLCPHCAATTGQTKMGLTQAGSQRFRCRTCRRAYTPQPKPRPRRYPVAVQQQALRLYLESNNFRRIASIVQVAPQTVINWVNAYHAALPAEPDRSQEKVDVVEMDELFTFIGSKKRCVRDYVRGTGDTADSGVVGDAGTLVCGDGAFGGKMSFCPCLLQRRLRLVCPVGLLRRVHGDDQQESDVQCRGRQCGVAALSGASGAGKPLLFALHRGVAPGDRHLCPVLEPKTGVQSQIPQDTEQTRRFSGYTNLDTPSIGGNFLWDIAVTRV